jgi:hypothetical protein
VIHIPSLVAALIAFLFTTTYFAFSCKARTTSANRPYTRRLFLLSSLPYLMSVPSKLPPLEARPASTLSHLAIGAAAVGALAVGALAVGALAIGALSIGQLALGRGRVRRLRIHELEIDHLVVHEHY